MVLKVAQVPSTAKHFIIDYYYYQSETVSKAKLFFSEAKRSETFVLWFLETEAKRSETVSVSLSFALFRFEAKLFKKQNWDTLGRTEMYNSPFRT